MDDCVALILAGGRGTRLGADTPKQFLPLGGKTVLRHAAEAFLDHPAVDRVRVVIAAGDRPRHDEALSGLAVMEPVPGGASRQDSALRGLESLCGSPPRLVLIHDAARPFPGPGTIERTVRALERHPAAAPALPLTDTIKEAHGGLVDRTVDRSRLRSVQTPQGFRFPQILAAHRAAAAREATDDAAVAEQAGLEVALVAGSKANIKITTEDDLVLARRLLGGEGTQRTGFGFDVHAFGSGDSVTLCGVEIPHDRGLIGHSDADAALHAVTDALFGAVGAGDIGMHFPPTDPAWRGAASEVFLRRAADLVAEAGGAVVNIDLTIVCESPRIGPYRATMRARLAGLLGVDAGRVNVKATTTEGLGFTGRGEGVAAQAVAVVHMPR